MFSPPLLFCGCGVRVSVEPEAALPLTKPRTLSKPVHYLSHIHNSGRSCESLACSWDTKHQVVWHRGGLQCHGLGSFRPQSGRPLQFLPPEVHSQNGVDACRPAGKSKAMEA